MIDERHALEDLTDEELITRHHSGEDGVLDALIARHTLLIRRCARRFFLHDGALEDLVQEGMIGLLEAVRSYRPDRGASFRTFASVCASRRIMNAVERSVRRSRPIPGGRGSASLPSEEEAWPSSNGEVEWPVQLSGLEAEVLHGVGKGEQLLDIAARLGRAPRSIYNAMSRIRQKLKTLMDPRQI